jgi:predicted O-methyltransferase YrrM
LPAISRLRRLYLHWLSRPHNDRLIYRVAHWQRAGRIVEVGMGTGRRALRMIEAAAEHLSPSEIRYTGIDLFESRDSANPGWGLKEAYQRLKATGVRVQLAPGDPCTALASVANTLAKIDLMVVSASVDQAALAQAWFYVPRILHPQSQVFLEEIRFGGKSAFRLISVEEVAWLAAKSRPMRRAA